MDINPLHWAQHHIHPEQHASQVDPTEAALVNAEAALTSPQGFVGAAAPNSLRSLTAEEAMAHLQPSPAAAIEAASRTQFTLDAATAAEETPMSTAAVTPEIAKPSLFARVKAELKTFILKLEHEEPAAEKVALGTIALVVPIATTVLTIEDPAIAPLVAPIAARVQAGLAALTVAIESAGAQPTIASVANGIISQLSQLEQVAGIKDPKTLANIETISVELQNIIDAFSAPAA